jgi:hypothetical protein
VVISASTYGGNVLADVSKNDEISVDVGVDASIKPLNVDDNDVLESPSDTSYMDECGVWLAPSTIPGAGLGIFSGRDFKKKEQFMPTGDVVVPIVDIMMHQKGRKFTFLWDEYTWNGKSLGLGHEVVKECNGASPGFGAAANAFLDLTNVNEGDPENDIPHSLHRSKDPGAGGFTTYHNRRAYAKINVKAGQE